MPGHSDEVVASLRELNTLVLSQNTVDGSLDRVARLSAETVPGAWGVGVTLVDPEKGEGKTDSFTAAYSSERVMAVDRDQYETGEGPCLDCIKLGEVLEVRSLEEDDRYPSFKSRALRKGVRSTLSAPLVVGDVKLGALNLYGGRANAFPEGAVELAQAFASQAAVTITNQRLYQESVELAQNLQKAMDSRATIEQAKGMIMLQRRCSAEQAFETLVSASQHRNKKLREIAEDIVAAATDGGAPFTP
jgi:GAF domain-containing protein